MTEIPVGRRRVARGARTALRVVAAAVSISLLLAMGWFHYSYAALDSGLNRVTVGGLGPAPTPTMSAGSQQVNGPAQNLLVIGSDSRAGLSQAEIQKLHVGAAGPTTSTDTLMVVHVPADGSRATLISIPRDTYVDIPGFDKNKINAAFVDGYTNGTSGFPVTASSTEQQRQAAGLTLLIDVVKNLTGLNIDHYVLVSFLGFYNIAQAINGIDVNLCHAVIDTVAYNEAHGQGSAGSGFVMSAGRHHLDAVQSLEFVRQRHNLVDSAGRQLNDFGREARQRYFLGAAFARVESAGTLLNPSRLSTLIDALRSTLTIDSGLSLEALAHQVIDLSSNNITGQSIPTQGTRTFPAPVGQALIADPTLVRKQVAAWLAPKAPGASSRPTPSKPTTSAAPDPTGAISLAPAQPAGCVN